jgi:hypothetical protein
VAGRVFGGDSVTALADVRVAFSGTTNAVTTGADGSFVLRMPPAGRVGLEVTREGYHAVNVQPLNFTARDTIHVRAVLQPLSWMPPARDTRGSQRCAIAPCVAESTARRLHPPLLIIDNVLVMPADPSIVAGPPITFPVPRLDPFSLEIERIEVVLGGDAARLYGDRAEMGVIIVTSRRPRGR